LTASLLGTAIGLLAAVIGVLVSSNVKTSAALMTADEERSKAEARERESIAARLETSAALATAVEQRDAAIRNAYVAHMQMARHASERLDFVSLERLLNAYVPAKLASTQAEGESDLRHWEWYHHRARIRRIVRGKYQHARSLYGVAWSADGKQVAASGSDGRILLCDADARLLRAWDGHSGVARMVSFAPGGNRLASLGDDGAVRIWRTADGKLERELTVSGASLECVAFEREGTRVAAGGNNGHVYIWDVEGGKQLADLFGERSRSALRCLAWRADGKSIPTGGNRLRVWDEDVGRLVSE
jgi:WD40 repeat protein